LVVNGGNWEAGGRKMKELLTQLDKMIEDLESQSLVLRLKVTSDRSLEILQTLCEGKACLRMARAALRQTQYLVQKGYGKLVEPEEEGHG